MRENEFARSQMSRRQLYSPDENPHNAFYVCSPEDTILQKLVWYRMTARESQKQWRDILGVLKLQGESLNFDYLCFWGDRLELLPDLDRALTEAGLLFE
ncbi:MAG: hypothetical protein AAGA60_16915 [Cyanobacteria bacterium P01_E01_bin.42]